MSLSLAAQDLAYQQFTVEDGLPSNQVYSIHQDRDGFIWLGTENGLSRFDGQNFVNYTVFDGLPDTEILNFKEDSQNRLWFHSLNGKLGYYKDGQFYSGKNLPYLKEAFLGNLIIDSVEDKEGNLYFLSSHKILKIDKQNKVYKIDHPFKPAAKFFLDKKGNPYLNFITSDKNTFYHLQDFKAVQLDFTEFDKKNLQGLVGLKIQKISEIYDFGEAQPTLKEDFNSGLIEKDNKLWVYGANNALQIFSTKETTKKIYHNDNIKGSRVFVDRDNNIWVGSLGKGVFSFKQPASYHYKKNEELKGSVFTSLYLDENSEKIYCGSNEGNLNIIAKNGIQHFQLDNISYSFPRIRDIERGGFGSLWVVCDSHLEKIDERTAKQNIVYPRIKTSPKAFIAPKSIYMMPDSSVFFVATAFGLDRIGYGQYPVSIDNLFTNRTSECYVDEQKTLWVGTGNGLYKSPNLGQEKDFVKLDLDDPITCFAHLNSTLIVGTKGKGLLLINGEHIQRLTTVNGLASNLIRAIYIAKDQSAWISTNKGLNKCNNIQSVNPVFGTITKQNGLISNDVVDCGIMDTTLYVLCSQGLSKIPLVNIKDNFSAPNIKIESIQVNNKVIHKDSIHNLKSHQNNLSVQFTSIYYGNRENLQYYYKLLGYHENWCEAKRNYLLFEKLPPQKYTLAITTNPDTENSDSITQIDFEIIPAFYQRKIVQALSALLLGFALLYIIRFFFAREKEKSKIEKRLLQLEQIALQSQMNPHFIKNSLGAIQHLMIKKDVRTANKYLTVFGELITQLLRQSDQSQIKVIDEIKILKLYLSIEKLRFDNNFEYIIDCQSKNILDDKIPSMMIQPLIENSILHGFKDSSQKRRYLLNLSFQPNGDYVDCVVKDNGSGMQKDKPQSIIKKQGIAMNNIKERISLLAIKKSKTAFNILKSNSQGTEIHLCLPLEKNDD